MTISTRWRLDSYRWLCITARRNPTAIVNGPRCDTVAAGPIAWSSANGYKTAICPERYSCVSDRLCVPDSRLCQAKRDILGLFTIVSQDSRRNVAVLGTCCSPFSLRVLWSLRMMCMVPTKVPPAPTTPARAPAAAGSRAIAAIPVAEIGSAMTIKYRSAKRFCLRISAN